MYCYGSHWQLIFDDLQTLGVIFHPNLPNELETLFPPSARPGMLILGDLMQEAAQSPQVTQLLTCGTHHLELFAITLMQNLYPGGREQATQNHNSITQYCFKIPPTPVTSKLWAIVGWETVKRFGNSI